MLKKMAFAVGVSLAIASAQAGALGLGDLQIESPLSQPLRARIPITGVSRGKLDRIKIIVPGASVYRQAGIPRIPLLDQLDIKVVTRGGKPYVRLTTQQPVSNPALDFLLLIRESGGTSIREFTGFLNPPGYSVDSKTTSKSMVSNDSASMPDQGLGSTSTDVMPATASTDAERAVGVAERETDRDATRAAPAAKAKTTDAHGSATTYGPVRPNQTLWSIAKNHRPADHSINMDQVLVGIYRKNPSAFGGDINNLFVGSMLTIPSADYYRTINPSRARRWVIAKTQSVKPQRESRGAAKAPTSNGTLELTATDGSSAAPSLKRGHQTAEPGTAAPVTDATADQDGGGTVRLSDAALVNLLALASSVSSNSFKLVPLPPEHKFGSDLSANEDGNVAANTLTSQKPTSKPASMLAGNNAKQVADPAAAAGTMSASTSSNTTPEKGASGDTTTNGKLNEHSEPPVADAATVNGGDLKTVKGANKPQPAVGKPKKTDMLSMEQLREAGIILGLVFLLALLLVHWWVKRQSPSQVQAAEPVRPSTVDTASANAGTAVQVVGTEQDEAQAALADADFNIAYGLYEKAVNGLQPALANHPDHRELRLKELEALHGAGDISRFNERAQAYSDELQDQTDNGDWLAIEHMRRDLGQVHDAADQQSADLSEDTLAPLEEATVSQSIAEETESNTVETESTTVETNTVETNSVVEMRELDADDEQVPEWPFEPEDVVDANGHEPPESKLEEEQTPHTVEFDVADLPFEDEVASSDADKDDESGLDFSLDDDLSETVLPGEQTDGLAQTHTDGVRNPFANEASLDFGDPAHLNVDEDQDEAFGTDESMGTKLDLARAYLDMDDPEMASDLLEDVISQGDESQQQEAQQLKQRIA